MRDPGSLTRSPIWVPCNSSILTTGQPGKFPSIIIIIFWRPKNFSLIPTLALCTQEGAAAGKAGTSPLSFCTILQAGEHRVENVLQDGVKPRMTPQASWDWLLSLATSASAFQFILGPQLAPSWLCPGQTGGDGRAELWAPKLEKGLCIGGAHWLCLELPLYQTDDREAGRVSIPTEGTQQDRGPTVGDFQRSVCVCVCVWACMCWAKGQGCASSPESSSRLCQHVSGGWGGVRASIAWQPLTSPPSSGPGRNTAVVSANKDIAQDTMRGFIFRFLSLAHLEHFPSVWHRALTELS